MNYEEALRSLAESVREASSSVSQLKIEMNDRINEIEVAQSDLRKEIEMNRRLAEDAKALTPQTNAKTIEENNSEERFQQLLNEQTSRLDSLAQQQKEIEESVSGLASFLTDLQITIDELSIESTQVEISDILTGE